MEVDVPGGCHQRADGLEYEPAFALDPHWRGVDGGAEHAADQRDFPRGQRALPADRADKPVSRRAQWPAPWSTPPAATSFSGTAAVEPSAKVAVKMLAPPAVRV